MIYDPPEKRWQVLAGCFAIGLIYALIFFFGV
jgi:hypothetical protein